MDALIFDFDGTIVDTEPLHEAALREALEPLGIPVREGMTIGLADEDAIAKACEQAGCKPLPDDRVREVFLRKVEAFTGAMELDHVIVFPGAVELLTRAAMEMPVGVCTAATRAEVEPIIRWLGIDVLLSGIVTADDVEFKKPSPDAYRLACRGLGIVPDRAVALEDSPRGVRSAVDAGLTTVALEHTTARDRLGHAHEIVPSTDGLTLETLRKIHAKHGAVRR